MTDEEKKVKKMTRYQVEQMTLSQLYIAAEYEKFEVSDLIKRAKKVVTGSELEKVLNHINGFETNRTGSWYQASPTVKW